MYSPLEVELGAVVAPIHGTRNVTVLYGSTAHSDYHFRAHKHVLWAASAEFQRQFESKEYDIGSTITIPHKNIEAVEDMLRYFYLKRYHPHPLPSVPFSQAEDKKRLAAHHAAVYDLARQKRYGIRDLSELALTHFQRGADEALAWLDQPGNNTAKNAVSLLRMYVDLIYENDDDTWETFEGQDIPDMMKSWPLRGLVCETAARIWVRAQRWNAPPAAGQAGGQEHGEEEVEIDAGDTVEDVVKEELAKLCWKYAHFAQDFARWMLIKGEVSITLGHDTMARTRNYKW